MPQRPRGERLGSVDGFPSFSPRKPHIGYRLLPAPVLPNYAGSRGDRCSVPPDALEIIQSKARRCHRKYSPNVKRVKSGPRAADEPPPPQTLSRAVRTPGPRHLLRKPKGRRSAARTALQSWLRRKLCEELRSLHTRSDHCQATQPLFSFFLPPPPLPVPVANNVPTRRGCPPQPFSRSPHGPSPAAQTGRDRRPQNPSEE